MVKKDVKKDILNSSFIHEAPTNPQHHKSELHCLVVVTSFHQNTTTKHTPLPREVRTPPRVRRCQQLTISQRREENVHRNKREKWLKRIQSTLQLMSTLLLWRLLHHLCCGHHRHLYQILVFRCRFIYFSIRIFS